MDARIVIPRTKLLAEGFQYYPPRLHVWNAVYTRDFNFVREETKGGLVITTAITPEQFLEILKELPGKGLRFVKKQIEKYREVYLLFKGDKQIAELAGECDSDGLNEMAINQLNPGAIRGDVFLRTVNRQTGEKRLDEFNPQELKNISW